MEKRVKYKIMLVVGQKREANCIVLLCTRYRTAGTSNNLGSPISHPANIKWLVVHFSPTWLSELGDNETYGIYWVATCITYSNPYCRLPGIDRNLANQTDWRDADGPGNISGWILFYDDLKNWKLIGSEDEYNEQIRKLMKVTEENYAQS